MSVTTAALPDVSHHRAAVNGTSLHYVTAGDTGSPVLLVHGFPESWWAFHKLIPLLAAHHRVIAVDLRGFGDSDNGPGDYDSATSAGDLHQLIAGLGRGRVHLVGQGGSGASLLRLATTYPEDIRSFTAVEMGLPGFGLEALADVTRGGAWHIGVLAAPGIPELLLAGREHAFLSQFAFPAMTAVPGAVSASDIDEFARTYARPEGFRGASGLYSSMLSDGEDIVALAEAHPLKLPVLAVGGGGGRFTYDTMAKVTAGDVRVVDLDGVGHYVALEAPEQLAAALLDFFVDIDAR